VKDHILAFLLIDPVEKENVQYASLGDDQLKELHARARQWLARMGEDDAIVARHLELGGEAVQAANYLEKAARRALAANALGDAVRLAEKSLAFAEDKPTQFARAQVIDEAWNRLGARAGESAAETYGLLPAELAVLVTE